MSERRKGNLEILSKILTTLQNIRQPRKNILYSVTDISKKHKITYAVVFKYVRSLENFGLIQAYIVNGKKYYGCKTQTFKNQDKFKE